MNKTLLTRLQDAQNIYEKYDIEHVYLVGSYARGEERPESDIDLYISSNTFLDIYKYMNLKFELEDRLGKPVDILMENNLKPGIAAIILEEKVQIQ